MAEKSESRPEPRLRKTTSQGCWAPTNLANKLNKDRDGRVWHGKTLLRGKHVKEKTDRQLDLFENLDIDYGGGRGQTTMILSKAKIAPNCAPPVGPGYYDEPPWALKSLRLTLSVVVVVSGRQ
ncbi:hypothetical protein CRG98_042454 [Punica granatum]|uniref:Uncharacterized protein n=1 Tax=Punica granatum TaxID=22663 RepID=A0A2I0HZI2_PUNGR|nr:hypothetical protein CRG98_042454 [Punica granatum]